MKLEELARNGNAEAAELLIDLTYRFVTELNQIAHYYPEHLRSIARTTTAWPYFISKSKRIQSIGNRLLKTLTVGEAAMIGGKSHWHSPAFKTASWMVHWLSTNTRVLQLPAPTRRSIRIWFEVGWQRLLLETDNRPDKDGYLARIGGSAARKNPTSRGMGERTDGMVRDDVTAKIREVLWNSFSKMFKHIPP
ncbi:MAG TPA: hypothetical protein VFZ59_12460 [Verrucomicrobiae bacterium]|nr:hypothetical protein [Verrucomicrobiae bacterium]